MYVSQYAMYHSSRHFKDPDVFVPERWLEGANGEYSGDKKEGWNPFSFGPRNCIGKKYVSPLFSSHLWSIEKG